MCLPVCSVCRSIRMPLCMSASACSGSRKCWVSFSVTICHETRISATLELSVLVRLMDQWTGICLSAPPDLWLEACIALARFSCGCWGFKFRSLCFHGKSSCPQNLFSAHDVLFLYWEDKMACSESPQGSMALSMYGTLGPVLVWCLLEWQSLQGKQVVAG